MNLSLREGNQFYSGPEVQLLWLVRGRCILGASIFSTKTCILGEWLGLKHVGCLGLAFLLKGPWFYCTLEGHLQVTGCGTLIAGFHITWIVYVYVYYNVCIQVTFIRHFIRLGPGSWCYFTTWILVSFMFIAYVICMPIDKSNNILVTMLL